MIEKAMYCKKCCKPYANYDGTQSEVCACSEEVFDKLGNIVFPTDQEIEEAWKK